VNKFMKIVAGGSALANIQHPRSTIQQLDDSTSMTSQHARGMGLVDHQHRIVPLGQLG
jgi:hypothetical protein